MGQHPLVSRLLRGAFNQQPPTPCYEVTWDVSVVLNYIESLGESDSLSLQILTWKLAMNVPLPVSVGQFPTSFLMFMVSCTFSISLTEARWKQVQIIVNGVAMLFSVL